MGASAIRVIGVVDAPPEKKTPTRRTGGKYADLAAQVRKVRGRWLEVEGFDRAGASNIGKGVYADFRPAGAYVAELRTIDGKTVTYIRYKGGRAGTTNGNGNGKTA